ncbi:hypothetical protein PORY_001240 [Pneumocystis oryctolagi]|uniref:Uncharacterized protein n=1 Tax=Pneumocystis oryctolagi TaxID=42067 RepID=A0ACB7CCE5_9ASCO|nr:hypothetical protein PORY_001240 [Pneumocystis oryctolagi]
MTRLKLKLPIFNKKKASKKSLDRKKYNDLYLEEFTRYSRQMVLPEIGIEGQKVLKKAKILVIGAGGLGCPALAYLAGAGIGTIGIVDGDYVDVSNCHRQILHTSSKLGKKKVNSAIEYLKELNPLVNFIDHSVHISPSSSISIIESYDIVLDCTDNQPIRYLISDTCVFLKKPLVSASAIRTEGQLCVYGFQGSCCYRCLFPVPSPKEANQTCEGSGILGMVVGIMGTLQALEAIKILVSPQLISHYNPETNSYISYMTMFSAFSTPQFKSIKLRPRNSLCPSCGDKPLITKNIIEKGVYYDLDVTCVRKELSEDKRITELNSIFQSEKISQVLLIDVRDETQFRICSLPFSINIPLVNFYNFSSLPIDTNKQIYIICRSGNDSQLAVKILHEKFNILTAKDVIGGLKSWSTIINKEFPIY